LEITLEDYHESRKLYGQTSNMNFENFKKKRIKETMTLMIMRIKKGISKKIKKAIKITSNSQISK